MIRLILSILLPILFIGNYWACEFLFPGSDKDWAVFIPMDKMAHNIWSVTIFVALGVAMLKTKYKIGDLFLLFTLNLSFIDVLDRKFEFYDFDTFRYCMALGISGLFACIIHFNLITKLWHRFK